MASKGSEWRGTAIAIPEMTGQHGLQRHGARREPDVTSNSARVCVRACVRARVGGLLRVCACVKICNYICLISNGRATRTASTWGGSWTSWRPSCACWPWAAGRPRASPPGTTPSSPARACCSPVPSSPRSGCARKAQFARGSCAAVAHVAVLHFDACPLRASRTLLRAGEARARACGDGSLPPTADQETRRRERERERESQAIAIV